MVLAEGSSLSFKPLASLGPSEPLERGEAGRRQFGRRNHIEGTPLNSPDAAKPRRGFRSSSRAFVSDPTPGRLAGRGPRGQRPGPARGASAWSRGAGRPALRRAPPDPKKRGKDQGMFTPRTVSRPSQPALPHGRQLVALALLSGWRRRRQGRARDRGREMGRGPALWDTAGETVFPVDKAVK